MKNSGNIIIGMIASAAAGVVIGMLIAPEKGEDLRRKIRTSASDWTKKLRELLEEGKEHADEFAEEASQTAEGFKNGKS